LELFVDESRLKLSDVSTRRDPEVNVAELVQQDLSSACELLSAIESHWTDLDRLRQMSIVLADTASETRQHALWSELDVFTKADAELTEMLMLRITLLEKRNRSWTELTAQCSELKILLATKQETLQQTMLDTGLTPDQQYAVVKVRRIF